jgi:hypothetical protein
MLNVLRFPGPDTFPGVDIFPGGNPVYDELCLRITVNTLSLAGESTTHLLLKGDQ